MKNYNKILIICLLGLFTLSATAQDDPKWRQFEQHPPFRQLKCGLWINQIGDIACKFRGCEVNSLDQLVGVDEFQAWTYNIKDSIVDDMTEDDYISLLKDVIDTTSFKILNDYYFRDKSHIYIHPFMACSGTLFIAHDLDKKTFRTLKENPNYACDKNNCFVNGRYIKDADPATFLPIPNKENYPLSRDKNHFYQVEQKMDDKEVAAYEQGLDIKLFTQADVMNFTTEKFDSVKIVFSIDHSKEVSDVSEKECRYNFEIKGNATLTSKEIKALNHYLLLPRSFTDVIPALSHGDILVNYYKGDTVEVYGSISSLTRRFTLINGARTFEKSISPKFEKYLTRLLRSKGIWTKEQQFYNFEE